MVQAARPTQTQQQAQAEIEATFGKYRIVAALASGGMADVFLCVARGPVGFNKLQVVKRLKKHLIKDPDFVAMFLDEARLSARLNHPNIVQTNEVGQHDGAYFLAMEYLEGQSLLRVVREHEKTNGVKLPLRVYLRILTEVLAGLDYAHQLKNFDGQLLGFVHRDVTPHNVIVTYGGVAKLLDFGIAKAATNSNETRAGVLKGKVPYMAPEQIACESLTHRADIYAVGVMLWEALAGRRMWKGMEESKILRHVLKGELPSLEVHSPEAPKELAEACMRALSTDPEDRFESAGELQAVLDAYLDKGERVSNREVGVLVDKLFKDERGRIRETIDKQLAEYAANPDDSTVVPISVAPPPMSGTDVESNGGLYPMTTGDQTVKVPDLSTLQSSYGSGPGSNPSLGSNPSVGSNPQSFGSYPQVPVYKQPAWIAIFAVALLAGFAALSSLIVSNRARHAAQESPTASAPSTETPGTHATAAESSTAATAMPAAEAVSVAFSATPTTAKIFFDDVALSGNPFTGKFPKDGASHKLRAEAVGFETKSQLVTLNKDLDVSFKLTPALAPPTFPGHKPTAPTAPTASAPVVAATTPPPPPPTATATAQPTGPVKPKRSLSDEDPYK